MDLAKIGFAADTSGLERAVPALRKLVPAAEAVEVAADKASAALTETGRSAKVIELAAGKTSAALSETSKSAKVVEIAAGKAATALGGVGKSAATAAVAAGKSAGSFERMSSAFENAARGIESASQAYDVAAARSKKWADVQARINEQLNVKDSFGQRGDDIKAYGMEMDNLRAKYNPLFAASRAYKLELTDIRNALKVGAISEKEYAAAIMNTKVAFVQQVNSIRGVNDRFEEFNKGSDKTRAAYQGISFEAKNLSYQLVDVTQGLVSGQPIFMIAAQQLGQIAQVIATSPQGLSGLMKELGSAIARILTPMRLLVAGLIGVGIAAVAMSLNVIKTIKDLDDLSKSTDVSLQRLHQLQQVAGFKGIGVDEFAKGMQSFSEGVLDARNNTGELLGLMRANNMQAKTFDDYLGNVADLVARTNSGIQRRRILEAAGLPTTQEWVRLMSQGRKGIEDAAKGTVAFNNAAEKNLIGKAREFDNMWNKYTTLGGQYFKKFILDAIDLLSKFKDAFVVIGKAIGTWVSIMFAPITLAIKGIIAAADIAKSTYNSMRGTGPTRVTVGGVASGGQTFANDNNTSKTDAKILPQLLVANQQAQQRISILGELATVTDQVRQKQLELIAAGLQGVGVNEKQYAAIINLTRANAENNRVMSQAQIGVFNLNYANKAAQDTLQSWIDKGLLDPTNAEQMAAAHLVLSRNIKATGEAAAIAAAPLQGLKQLELDSSNFAKVLDTTVVGALGNVSTAIVGAIGESKSFGDTMKDVGKIVVRAIQEMIVKMLIIAPIAKGLQSILNPGGGILGSIGKFFGLAKGGVIDQSGVTPYANGGAFTNNVVNKPTLFAAAGGHVGVMGEAGPEAVMPLKRGPGGSLGVQMYQGGGASANDNTAMIFNYAPTFNVAQGADPKAIAELQKARVDDRSSFVRDVGNAVRVLRVRNVKGV